MSTPHPVVILTRLTFAWPDGTLALDDVTAAFNPGRTGLVGANGSGKSTLLRLIAGELSPSSGSVTTRGSVGMLPQSIAEHRHATVADVMGVSCHRAALRAIESGATDQEHFDVLADAWDIEARSRAELDRLGLTGVDLDRAVGTLSGGEAVLAALVGLQLAGHEVVLLDEPTNNLDRQARHLLYDSVTAWRGTVIVVSHDVQLLNLMDETAQVRDGCLSVFGGPFEEFRRYGEREQAAAAQALRTAENRLAYEQHQRQTAQIRLARRQRYARTENRNRRAPKIIMNRRKSDAQVSAGKLRDQLDDRVAAAQATVESQARRVVRDPGIAIDLPDPDVADGKRLAELRCGDGPTIVVQGPERIALTGRNGIGKTLLLRTLVGCDPHRGGSTTGPGGWPMHAVGYTDRIGYLPQRLHHLHDDDTVLAAVRRATPQAPPAMVRANLARFLFRGDEIHRRVGDLSGGERFRVALAGLLLRQPPMQLLVLDEPTNNLDLASIDELVDALVAYRGGLLVVSHDDAFLARLHLDTWLTLTDAGLAITPAEQAASGART